MSKKLTKKRLASAQERLRQIEKTIGPYVDVKPTEGRRPPKRWVPSDSVRTAGGEPKKSRRYREIAAQSS